MVKNAPNSQSEARPEARPEAQPKAQGPSHSSAALNSALTSYLGYLEGTEKARHTIKSYRLDLLSFYDFLAKRQTKPGPLRIEAVSVADLESYHEHLKASLDKTNTRRRKLLTAQRFLRYLSKRKQIHAQIPTKLPAPHKIERIPFTVSQFELLRAIEALGCETILDLRNRVLLRLLAETGCLVSEVGKLRFEDVQGHEIEIPGQATRKIPISDALRNEFLSLKERQSAQGGQNGQKLMSFIFTGYNRHGPLKTPVSGSSISARGVELLVKHYAEKLLPALEPGSVNAAPGRSLTPRTFRHSAVLAWFQAGVPQAEIQRRLGLKTAYAFRTFAPLLNPVSGPHPIPE